MKSRYIETRNRVNENIRLVKKKYWNNVMQRKKLKEILEMLRYWECYEEECNS